MKKLLTQLQSVNNFASISPSFGKPLVQSSPRRPNILTEDFCGLSRFLRVNIGIAFLSKSPQPFLAILFHTGCLQISFVFVATDAEVLNVL